MICGVKLRLLGRRHHESLDESKENIDIATPCKRHKLQSKKAARLMRYGRNVLGLTDSATQCKRRKLHNDRAANPIRSGRKDLGLTLSDDKLSDTLVKDLCANTDLTQIQDNLTQLYSPDLTDLYSSGMTSTTYFNSSLNESSDLYNELHFDTTIMSVSLDTSQCTLDDTRNVSLTSGDGIVTNSNQPITNSNRSLFSENKLITSGSSLVSNNNYLFTSSNKAVTNNNNLVSNDDKRVTQSFSGVKRSVSSRDCTASTVVSDVSSVSRDTVGEMTPQQSPLSDKTFTNWTQPRALHPRRAKRARTGGRSRSLTTSTPKVLSCQTGKTGNDCHREEKILFTDNYISHQNLRRLGSENSDSNLFGNDTTTSDSSLKVSDYNFKVRDLKPKVSGLKLNVSHGHNNPDLQDNYDLDLGYRRVQSCDTEEHNYQNSLLTPSLSDSQLTRIRRKAFRKLLETKRVESEGDSQRATHPSVVGVKEVMTPGEVMKVTGVKVQQGEEADSVNQDIILADRESTLEQVEQLRHRGLVRLSVNVSRGSLTVHVMEAKNLQSRWSDRCSAYVQTSLVPDENQSIHKTTSVVTDTNSPQFNQKLTYDLKSEDEKKRVMVSCWSKSESKNCGEFLGCMSFGIKHMMSKKKPSAKKESWYYLLSENIGHRKHLEAQTDVQKDTQCAQLNTEVEERLQGLTESTIVIRRGYLGYGFTVKGEQPVQVGRVKVGGAAEDADLRNGDMILRINSTDVTMATTEAVAEIIRISAVQVTLEVKRSKGSSLYESSFSVNQRPVTDDNQNYVSHTSPVCTSAVVQGDESSPDCVSWQPELSDIKEESQENRQDTTNNSTGPKTVFSKQISDISDISGLSALSSWQQSSVSKLYSTSTTIQDITLREWSQSTMATNLASLLRDEDVRRQGPFSGEEDTSSSEEGSVRLPLPRSSSTPSRGSAQTCSSHSTPTWTTISHSSTDSTDITIEPENRQSLIQKLLTCEESFARKMHRGIQRFSRPLRHKILTVKQHSTLFQNIEKLVAMSDFNLRQLSEKSYSAESSYIDTTDDVIVDAIGVVYKSRVKLMCEAYERYQAGLHKAFSLLAELNRKPDFEKFSRRTAAKSRLELTDFLERPIKHLTSLLHYTTKVLRYTFPEHEDHRDLRGVVDALKTSCKKIQNSSNLRHSRLASSTGSVTSSMMSSVMSAVSSTASDSLRSVSRSQISGQGHSMLSASSVDKEVMSLQQNLSFAKDVKPFQLAVPSRHVIYSGEMSFVINDSETLPLWVILCSDLILLTTRDMQGHLVVVDDPIYLQEAVHVNFSCANASEFLLVTHSDSLQRAFRLRSPTTELKWAWKNILEHRIKSCSAHSQGDGASQGYHSNYA